MRQKVGFPSVSFCLLQTDFDWCKAASECFKDEIRCLSSVKCGQNSDSVSIGPFGALIFTKHRHHVALNKTTGKACNKLPDGCRQQFLSFIFTVYTTSQWCHQLWLVKLTPQLKSHYKFKKKKCNSLATTTFVASKAPLKKQKQQSCLKRKKKSPKKSYHSYPTLKQRIKQNILKESSNFCQ